MTVSDKICYYCGNNGLTTVKWWLSHSPALLRCQKCGLLRIDPVSYHDDDSYEQLGESETQRQLQLRSETDTTSFNHGNGILDLVENFCQKGKLLDIGCKTGDMLKAASLRSWVPVGLDVNPSFVSVARERGFEVYDRVLEQLDPDVTGFDVVVMSHVLEHIKYPAQTLQAVYQRLNSSGYLYVETPDVSSPIAWAVYRKRWLGVATPGHVWAFTSRTLQKVIQEQGYSIVWANRWIPYGTRDYPKTLKGQVRRVLFTLIRALGYGDIVGVLAKKR